MSKDDLRLKAVNSLSSFFRKAATALDSLTSVHAEWEGIFPHPTQFEENTESGHTELRYRLGGKLALDELRLKHDANRVYLQIAPNCRDYLIPNFDALSQQAGAALSEEVLEKYSALRWDTASTDEVKSFFLDAFSHRTSDTDFWAVRAAKLLCLVFEIAKEQAKHDGEELTAQRVRNALPLDRLIEASQSAHWLSADLSEELRQYLFHLPAYSEDDALSGSVSAKVYEHHGYLTMQLSEMFFGHSTQAIAREYRLRSTEIEYQADAPISSVSAKVDGGVLVVSVKHVDTKPKKVEIAV